MPPMQPALAPRKSPLIAILIAILFALAVFVILWVRYPAILAPFFGASSSDVGPNWGLTDTSVTRADVGGVLLMSGVEQSASPIRLQTYSLNFGVDTLTLENESAKYQIFSSSFAEFEDPNDPTRFFFRSLTFSTSTDGTQVATNVLYHANADAVEEVSSEANQQFGTVNYSSAAERIAYSTLRDGFSDTEDAISRVSSWNVIIADAENTIERVIQGAAHPSWMPDGTTLVYLKKDGVYAFNRITGEETRLLNATLPEGAELPIGVMFDVSPDGRFLALTLGNSGRVDMYGIFTDSTGSPQANPLEVELIGRFTNEGRAYSWPVFSPDSTAYAVIAKDVGEQALLNPRIEVRSIFGREPIVMYALDDFDVGALYLDDWIARPVEL